MKKLVGILLLGLCANFITCSEKYIIVGVPTLHQLCQRAVKKDFYNKADQLFAIVEKKELNQADEQQLQKILAYNKRFMPRNDNLDSLVFHANNK